MKRTFQWKWVASLLFVISFPVMVARVQRRLQLTPMTLAWDPRTKTLEEHCKSNLGEVYRALLQYSQDNDGRLPSAVSGGLPAGGLIRNWSAGNNVYAGSAVGWADAIAPQLMSQTLLQCWRQDSIGTVGITPTSASYTDFWINGSVAGRKLANVRSPASTVLIGEGHDANHKGDATLALRSLPAEWATNENSPARRHLGGANYLFVDGHVAWLRPEEILNYPGKADVFRVSERN